MKRFLALWIVGWLVIGIVDLALGVYHGAPDGILVLAALTDVAFIVVGGFVIVFVYGSSRIIERVSERTLLLTVIVAVLLCGAGTILLPGVTVVACVALGLFAVGFGAVRLTPAVISGRRRGTRPDEEAARRNARRDAVFAGTATHTHDPATGSAEDEEQAL
jgi:Na+/melibiose symporter-like transporter